MSQNLKLKRPEGTCQYLYVSDTKVRMLFEQMCSTSKSPLPNGPTSPTGPVQGVAGALSEGALADRDDKVRAIEKCLLERNLVGTPQQPKEYFKGALPMRWGMYNGLG